MEFPLTPQVDLSDEIQIAKACAKEWGLDLGPPFGFSNVSYVVPTSDGAVLKVAWGGDTEALHEPDALELWDGNGAVRLLRRSGRVMLEERAQPGDDLSGLSDDVATKIALDVATSSDSRDRSSPGCARSSSITRPERRSSRTAPLPSHSSSASGSWSASVSPPHATLRTAPSDVGTT